MSDDINRGNSMDCEDVCHLSIGTLLLGFSIASIYFGFGLCVTVLLIMLLNLYLVALTVECAMRSSADSNKSIMFKLPNRTWALLLIVLLLIANISSFANIYLQSGGIEYKENEASVVMKDKWDSIYFSAVTVTTLGYGDFTPNKKGRKYVIFHLASGLLLLFYVVPIVASRISTWPKSA
jgi:hypothetical protein